MTQKLSGWGALALLGIAITWLVVSPYWTVSVLKTAIEERDAETINAHVDYPLLRESLKDGLRATMMAEMAKQKELAGDDLGDADFLPETMATLGLTLATNFIDNLVRPESIETMLDKVESMDKSRVDYAAENQKAVARDNYELSRTGLTTFEIHDEKTKEGILFHLDGITWKVIGLRMPKPAASDK